VMQAGSSQLETQRGLHLLLVPMASMMLSRLAGFLCTDFRINFESYDVR
jgi:hypothetical protein